MRLEAKPFVLGPGHVRRTDRECTAERRRLFLVACVDDADVESRTEGTFAGQAMTASCTCSAK